MNNLEAMVTNDYVHVSNDYYIYINISRKTMVDLDQLKEKIKECNSILKDQGAKVKGRNNIYKKIESMRSDYKRDFKLYNEMFDQLSKGWAGVTEADVNDRDRELKEVKFNLIALQKQSSPIIRIRDINDEINELHRCLTNLGIKYRQYNF